MNKIIKTNTYKLTKIPFKQLFSKIFKIFNLKFQENYVMSSESLFFYNMTCSCSND